MRKEIVGVAFTSLVFGAAVTQAAVLESPAHDATVSGIGFISGWKCDAEHITVQLDGGEPIPVAMRQPRGDLAINKTCGETIAHGFIQQINWGYVGDGEHEVVAYDAGVEFARATFTVGTTGEEFLKDVTRRLVIEDFPAIEEDTLLEWNESTQHFEVRSVWASPPANRYDRGFWRQYIADQRAGTFTTDAELYAAPPDLDRCVAGRLSRAAEDRALETANQIRALHGLPAVRWTTVYSREAQQAALLQAANGISDHAPDPSLRCYTAEGAAGSRSSNLYDGDGNTDPANHMVRGTLGTGVAGGRRWLLNPLAINFTYGQVDGYGVHKVFDYFQVDDLAPEVAVDFVAFPYESYPFPLVGKGAAWSFSVIVDPDDFFANAGNFFREATITVTRVADGVRLPISERYADFIVYGLPNFLSWQVEGWDYDTPYEVEIVNVVLPDDTTRSYRYSVFIERENLEQ